MNSIIKKIGINTVLFCCLNGSLMAQAKLLSKSDFIKVDFKVLAEKKAKLKAKDPALMSSYKQLILEADRALNYAPVSVMDKGDLPPSGNKHDYMSIGPYWWPDPSKPNGVPYIKRDGEVNPEVKNFPDKENLPKVCEKLYVLSLAYYFSGNEKYAMHASKLLNVWFIDTATKMNPNLNYGQAVKGKTEGRAEGLIETRHFVYLTDAINMLKGAKSWSSHDQTEMKKWFSQFLNWMMTSQIGKNEMNAKNNHAVWFDAQSLALAIFIDSADLANKIVLKSVDRLDVQMNNEGLFPLELERNTAFHYSVFILNAFELIAQLSENTKTNFWTIETKSGKSLKKGFDAIIPYISKEKKWTGKQINEFEYSDAYTILLRASSKYQCKICLAALKNLCGDDYREELFNLL